MGEQQKIIKERCMGDKMQAGTARARSPGWRFLKCAGSFVRQSGGEVALQKPRTAACVAFVGETSLTVPEGKCRRGLRARMREGQPKGRGVVAALRSPLPLRFSLSRALSFLTPSSLGARHKHRLVGLCVSYLEGVGFLCLYADISRLAA